MRTKVEDGIEELFPDIRLAEQIIVDSVLSPLENMPEQRLSPYLNDLRRQVTRAFQVNPELIAASAMSDDITGRLIQIAVNRQRLEACTRLLKEALDKDLAILAKHIRVPKSFMDILRAQRIEYERYEHSRKIRAKARRTQHSRGKVKRKPS
jgi:hypothetical protein